MPNIEGSFGINNITKRGLATAAGFVVAASGVGAQIYEATQLTPPGFVEAKSELRVSNEGREALLAIPGEQRTIEMNESIAVFTQRIEDIQNSPQYLEGKREFDKHMANANIAKTVGILGLGIYFLGLRSPKKA